MSRLPEQLYSAAQTRQLDRIAIEECGIPGDTLMLRAGTAAFALLRARWPRAHRLSIVCGPGNNGGDGYVVARLAHESGLQTEAMVLGDPRHIRGDARKAYDTMERAGLMARPFEADRLHEHDVIVDAIFGIGLEREVRGEWRSAIEAINATPVAGVLAIDIPSGVHADSGRPLGVAVQADITVTFIGLKTGLFTGRGRDYCGEIVFDDLDVPPDVYTQLTPSACRITEASLVGAFPRRHRSIHKGDVGHVTVVGGAEGMAGAARLAGEAAARAGAGLVTLATHPRHAGNINVARPELLTRGVSDGRALRDALRRATVLAVGPGLGSGEWGRELLAGVLDSALPKVLDADALNLLAADPIKRNDWILTPHPGEAARLLGTTGAGVQAQRFEALQALLDRFGGVCVLKGAGTLIGESGRPGVWLCDAGNPGMASGGMGDVLTGAMAALLAQGLAPLDAARIGVWVHAVAADDAAEQAGEVGLLASDLMPFIRRRLNQLARHAR